MALANAADSLARSGLRVLMIDFDLEAPGLEQFFQINQRRVRRHLGLLDLLLSYKQSMSVAAAKHEEYRPFTRLKENFVLPVYHKLPSGGRLDLLPAGQREDEEQLVRYALNLRTFDWQDFYFNWAGETFFEWLRQSLVPGLYDVVLVDSRTGLTEMGGICAYRLADTIVMFCASNHQSVEGTRNVVKNFFSPRVQSRRRHRPLQVIVVPARIEQRNTVLLESVRQRFEEAFDEYTPEPFRRAGLTFWDLLIPYEPRYALEERVVTEPSRTNERRQMAAAFQDLVGAIALLAEPGTALEDLSLERVTVEPRHVPAVEPQYDITRQSAGYDALLSYANADEAAVALIAHRLRKEAHLDLFLDRWRLIPGAPWQEAMEEALFQSRTYVLFIGPSGLGPWQENEELRAALEARIREIDLRVVPVLLPGAERGERGRLPAFLTRATWVEFRESLDDPDAFHRLVAGIKGIAPGRRLGEVVYEGVCPYRGLQVFQEEHAPFFFGREAATEWLVNVLRSSRFLAVVGPSGSGKSSLVRAGLAPALRRGDLPGSETWPLCVFRPGHRPLESLAAALIQLIDPTDDPTALFLLMDDMAADHRQLHLTTRLALADAPPDRTIALVVDQFEEIFTLCRDEGQRGPFIDNLLYASAIEGGRTVVVLTMRADFYGKCAAYPDLAARITDHQMLVSPMVEEELRRAIEGPAQVVGLNYEKGLVDTILGDVQAEPGALPLLQHALLELWERRRGGWLTFAAYREIGGIQGAIAHRAESIYASFDAEQQAITRRIMLRLTQPGEGTEDTRRRAYKSELLPTGEQAEATEAVIQTLADARLVTTSRDMATSEEQVDVSHEAVIRGWPRLREWIDEDRAGLRTHRRLTEAANEWEENNRDESYLYRGARLVEAEEWAEAYADDMNPLEREFMQASVALRDREAQEAERRRQRELEQTRRLAEERRKRVLWLSGALILAMIAAIAAAWFGRQAESRRLEAERQTRIALSRKLATQALNYLDGQFDLALLLSLEANHLSDVVEVRGSLLDVLEYNPRLTTFLSSHTDWVRSVAFSPDGKTLASAVWDNTIILWDVAKRRPIGQPLTGHTNWLSSVAFSPDGNTLASASRDNTIILWDVATRQPIGQPLTGHTAAVLSVAFGPDGKTLASGSEDNTIILWDVATRQPLGPPLSGHTSSVWSVFFSPDGKTLASGSEDGTIILWDVATRQPLGPPLTTHTGAVTGVVFSPDGKMLASGSVDNTIILWDVTARKLLGPPLTGHTASVYDVTFSPDSKTLASGSEDTTIILWDIATCQPLGPPLTGHTDSVWSVAFSSDGKTLASGSFDGIIILWDVSVHQRLRRSLTGHADWVRSVVFSPDGRTLASGSDDGTIILWDVPAGQRLGQPLTDHTDAVVSVALSPHGKTLASSSYNIIILWDVVSRQPIGQPLTGHADWVRSVAFSPDGKTLASASWDETIILWDVATGQPLGPPLTDHTAAVVSVAFSPDGKTLASGSKDNTIILWDVTTGQPLGPPLAGHTDWVLSVAFSPNGKMLASGSADNTILLWDAATGYAISRPFIGHTDWVLSVAFSPDGKMLASGSADNTIILWDVATGYAISRLYSAHTDWVSSVAFSPDGKTLASGSKDNTITLWDVGFDAWRNQACRVANRNLTQSEWDQFIGSDIPYERTCPDLPPGEGAPSNAPAATY